MFGNMQNPLGQPFKKEIMKIEQFRTLSGDITEIRWIQEGNLENDIWREAELLTIDPPLADSRIPESVADIRQCGVCDLLFHKESVLPPCQICGNHYCYRCRGTVKINKEETTVCEACAKEADKGIIHKISDWFLMKGN